MNLGKFGPRKKRIIPFFRLPEAQRKLFRRLKDNSPSIWADQTPPPSPLRDSEEEDQPDPRDKNPFYPSDLEKLNLTNKTMSTLRPGISEGILAADENFPADEMNPDETNDQEESNPVNSLNDTNHQNFNHPPPPNPPITMGSGKGMSYVGLDGQSRSSNFNQAQRLFISNQKAFRLTQDKPISHVHIIKFQAQLQQND
jgi:hypothetical protein